MGTLRGDNGGERSPDGGGLPDLPPEWGVVVIPDDAAELDREAAQLRRELRRKARQSRWRHRLGMPANPSRAGDDDTPALGLPLLIMSIAIIATLTSLFALAWPGRPGQPKLGAPAVASAAPSDLPDMTLTDAGGAAVRLRDMLPAVVLIVDGCTCPDLVKAAADSTPAKVAVLVVAQKVPSLPADLPAGRTVRAIADPAGTLRSTYVGSLPVSTVVAILVKSGGKVLQVVQSATATDITRYLSQLS
jgi:hypothetical protein